MAELPVDQGYAWAVAAGCFMCVFWNFGITRTLGMVFIEVVEHYHASSALSSVMFSIYSVCGLIAMFVHMFIQGKVSDRLIACVSGILSGLSLILINCSPNIYLFVFLFGIMQGFAFNGVMFSSMITLGHYMKERLNLVSGVVFAAGGLGQLVLPQLFRYLLSQYDIRGAFLILGGCLLNILVGASLFRPKSYYEEVNKNLKEICKNKSAVEVITSSPSTADWISSDDVGVWSTRGMDNRGFDNPSFSHGQAFDNTLENNEPDQITKQDAITCQFENQSNTRMQEGNQDNQLEKISLHGLTSEKSRPKKVQKTLQCSDTQISKQQPNDVLIKEGDQDNQLDKMSLHGMTGEKRPHKNLQKSMQRIDTQIVRQQPSIQTFENDLGIKVTKGKQQIGLKEAVTILCKSRTFLLFIAGRVFTAVSHYTCVFFYPPYLKSLGFGLSRVSFLMSVVGIADIPAKVFHGWATSYEKIDATVYTGLVTMLANIIIGVCVLLPSFASQIGIAIVIGSLLSANSGLMNVLVMDCAGSELFPKALVLTTISCSIFMAGLPVIYGWLYDVTGSYFIQMCVASVSGVLGGVITIVEAKMRQPIQHLHTQSTQT